MKQGIYEQVIHTGLGKELEALGEANFIGKAPIEEAEARAVLTQYISKIIRN